MCRLPGWVAARRTYDDGIRSSRLAPVGSLHGDDESLLLGPPWRFTQLAALYVARRPFKASPESNLQETLLAFYWGGRVALMFISS